MSAAPASQLNLSARHADFTYRMTVNAIKIQDTGECTKSVSDDLRQY